MFPHQFLALREEFNQRLFGRVYERYGDSFVARQIIERIRKGRKIRSILFSKLACSLKPDLSEEAVIDVALSIEMCHAASVLVDDILDGDDIRHGAKASQSELGTNPSVILAHFLCAEALTVVGEYPKVQQELIKVYRKLTMGEMHDILLPQPREGWIFEGYTERVFQKTSALFEYSFVAAVILSDGMDWEKVRGVGHMLGKLYQLSNDYYDLQPHNLSKRHLENQRWPITFSLPLAVYLEKYRSGAIQDMLTKGVLVYNEWLEFLKIIWTTDVTADCFRMMMDCQRQGIQLIEASHFTEPVNNLLQLLTREVAKEEFWYHTYDMA